MFHETSRLIKISAYIFLIGGVFQGIIQTTTEMSYLNTGKLVGAQSMLSMLWSCFLSFLISLFIYGFGVIVEFFENKTSELSENK